MKMTLLEMTQDILSALNSDSVDSISDTTESLQVANCIKSAYFSLLSKYDLPENNQLFQLTASGDSGKPVLMYKPDGVTRIEWIKYFDSNPSDSASIQTYSHDVNTDIVQSVSTWTTTSTSSVTIGTGSKTWTVGSGLTIATGDNVLAVSGINQMTGSVTSYSGTTLVVNVTKSYGSGTYTDWVISEDTNSQVGPGYLDVEMVSLEKFMHMTNHLNPADSNVGTFTLTLTNENSGNPQSFTFNYRNDLQPQNCCILSDYYVIFDAYDNTQDSTLQSSKVACYGWITPSFSMTDTFIPALDDNVFPMLANEAKSLAFYELKQQVHQKAEQEIKRQRSSIQKFKEAIQRPKYFDQFQYYGRR